MSVASASAIPGPPSLQTGFDSDTLFFDDGTVNVWFPRMEQLHSHWVRVPVNWTTIAATRPSRASNPSDPHYYWATLDQAVRAAAAAHQTPILMLEAPPSWALGSGASQARWPNTWRPNPRAFGAFARAVATRYSGHFRDPSRPGQALPRIPYFQVWNEPNLPALLEPQWTRTRHGWAAASPVIYRSLLNAAYKNIKSVQRHAYVLAAGLAPYGDPPGLDRMRPVTFLRELLCLHGDGLRPGRCPNPAHLDAVDIHPYAASPTVHALNPNDVSVPDLGRLTRVLRAAERTHRLRPLGPKPIWVSEIAWDSKPPNPYGLPLARQSRYLSLAFYEIWLQGSTHVLWYEVQDVGVSVKSFTGAGLFFGNGAAKPSAFSFRFPFVAIRSGGAVTIWGRAPKGGVVTIQVARRHGWRRLLRLGTTRGGVFYTRRHVASHTLLRAREGNVISQPWAT